MRRGRRVDWTHFTPWASLLGGILLGIATSLLILFNGRVLGVCGIVAGLLRPERGDTLWRVALIAGLVASPWLVRGLAVFQPTWFTIAAPQIDADWPVVAGAGIIVGVGTRYANGCTSGHGVCGLARLSPRSAIATVSFMAAGFLTVFLTQHVLHIA